MIDMSEGRAEYIAKLSDLAEALTPDVELGANEAKLEFEGGWDITSRSTEQLLGELTFYRWLAGFSHVLKAHRIAGFLPKYENRYGSVLAELQARGVDVVKDHTSRQDRPKPTGGVEL